MSAPSCPDPRPAQNLCEVRCGALVRVVGVQGNERDTLRLRELGFCESAHIRKLAEGGALLCLVCGVKIALGRDLASGVLVQPVGS